MDNKEFSKQVIEAIDERTTQYNSTLLPQVLEKYRLIHTCVKNIIDVLTQKTLIKPDPYKLEKKISDVEIIPNEPYLDGERSLVIGTRISNYESILDFICTYNNFSVENMNFNKIKKFVDFNNTFNWHAFTANSSSPNTKGFAILFSEAKQNVPPMTANMMHDNIAKCDTLTKEINLILKELSEFQKEVYKAFIRKDIFEHPKFNLQKASESMEQEMAEIKRVFPSVAGKTPFYAALVEEIVNEDLAPNKNELREQLLKKLKIEQHKTEKKEKTVDTKEPLMAAVHALSGLAPQLEVVVTKITENNDLLQNENNSFFIKLKKAFRKAFGLSEPPITYTINITDSATGSVKREQIEFQKFVANIQQKITHYNAFSLKTLPAYQKIENSSPEKILEFLNKQLTETQRILIQLNALDEFFKSHASIDNKQKVKGLKMELTTLKNTLVNTKQHRADYLSFQEELQQMKKLGILDEKY